LGKHIREKLATWSQTGLGECALLVGRRDEESEGYLQRNIVKRLGRGNFAEKGPGQSHPQNHRGKKEKGKRPVEQLKISRGGH